MELCQLRTSLTVADEGHLTCAAEKLFTNQPAMSAQIRALEEELGVRLFDRSPRGMTLTGAGVTLQEQARKIVNAARDFRLSAEALRGTVTGELVFGLNNRPEILRLMEILRNLTTDHPELRYEMVCGSSHAHVVSFARTQHQPVRTEANRFFIAVGGFVTDAHPAHLIRTNHYVAAFSTVTFIEVSSSAP